MGIVAAHFFGYVQGADFYLELHREAVALLPVGAGKTWFDVGCGPGLVTRLAHERGYDAVGFDLDPKMIVLAGRRRAHAAGPRFVQAGLDDLVARHGRADVVSAASLLSVVADRGAALTRLLDAVAPGGALLVIETSQMMSSPPPGVWQRRLAYGRRTWVLRLWARVRRGGQAVDVARLCPEEYAAERQPLLGGLVDAWIVRRRADTDAVAAAPQLPSALAGSQRA